MSNIFQEGRSFNSAQEPMKDGVQIKIISYIFVQNLFANLWKKRDMVRYFIRVQPTHIIHEPAAAAADADIRSSLKNVSLVL